jgi:hypothetical protein
MNEYNFIDFHINNIYDISLNLKDYNSKVNSLKTNLINKMIRRTYCEKNYFEKYKIIEYNDNIELLDILFINKFVDMIKVDISRLNITDEMVNLGKRFNFCDNILMENWINIIDRYDYDKIISNLHLTLSIDKDNLMTYDFIYKSDNMNINFKFIDHNDVLNYLSIDLKNQNCNMNVILNSYIGVINISYSNQDKKIVKIIEYNPTNYNHVINPNLITYERRSLNDSNYEWYEINYKTNFSKGIKMINLFNRKYDEEWYKLDKENSTEFKMRNSEDLSSGVKTHRYNGYFIKNENKIWEFNDTILENTLKGEISTIRQGFDENNKWLLKSLSTPYYELVENFANNQNNKWYEKWFNSQYQKFACKKGIDLESNWEEEWKEFYENNQKLNSKCYKMCSKYNGQNWYEEWDEKYCLDRVEKTCYKYNRDIFGVENITSWRDN